MGRNGTSMIMYRAVVGLKNVGDSPAYEGALAALIRGVQAKLAEGAVSWQMIETTCWIEKGGRYYKGFFDARDDACDLGVLVDGKVVWK